jgi:pimeloyl-ACP methyl ester carboxylesterase
MPSLFLAGWGAPAALYAAGLPAGWRSLQQPRFHEAAPDFDSYLIWLLDHLETESGTIALGGHSMGGALALAAAARQPDRIRRLVLVAPAGLPLCKPIHRSLGSFVAQIGRRRFPSEHSLPALGCAARAPRSAWRLAQSVRALDLSAEMRRIRRAGIDVTVVACSSDTLVTTAHCRRVARLLGARYRELDLEGGHMWMLDAWPRFTAELAA